MTKEAQLGLFVIAAFAVFLFFTVNMGKMFFTQGTRSLDVYFTTTGTLEKGAPVKQAGLDVGHVTGFSRERIEEPTGTIYTVVHVHLTDEAIISKDSSASIQSLTMMGDKYIEITYGSQQRDANVEQIFGQGPTDMDQLISGASTTIDEFNEVIGNKEFQQQIFQLIDNLEKVTAGLNTIVGSEKQRLDNIMQNIEASSVHLRSMMATAELFIADTRSIVQNNQRKIDKTIDNVSVISQDIRENLVVDLKEMSQDLKEFSKNLNSTVAKANNMMENMDGMISENRGDITSTISNIKKMSENADEASGRVNDILKAVQTEEGLVHDLIYDKELSKSTKSAVQKTTDFVEGISDLPNRFTFEADFRYFPDRPRFDSEDNNFRTDIGVQFDMTKDLYLFAGGNNLGSSNDLELQLGYRWRSLVLHGGMIESEVGLGLDWHLMDRWMIGMAGIGLTSDDEERLDAYSEIRVWNEVYLVGGVQDIADEAFPNAGLKVRF